MGSTRRDLARLRILSTLAVFLLIVGAGHVEAAHAPPPRLAVGADSLGQQLANLQLQSVACPDAHSCFAVGAHVTPSGPNGQMLILATRDGGATWTTVHKESGQAVALLSCPVAQRCYELGESYSNPLQNSQSTLVRTADGGKSWLRSPITPRGFMPARIDCPTATVCYVTGTAYSAGGSSAQPRVTAMLRSTRDGGRTWASVRLPAGVGPGLGALACSAATSCNLGGTVKEKSCFQAAVVSHTDDGGKTWVKLLDVCAAGISALACPTSRTCYAGGSYGMFGTPGNELVLHTDDAGASWDDQFLGAVSGLQDPTNPVSYAIIGIACPSAQICFLPLGHAMLATRNGGTRWTVQTSSTGAFLPAISCPTTRMCVAVGVAQPANQGPGPQQVNGVILRTLNGGATWTRP